MDRLEGYRGAITSFAFAPDGKKLASGGEDTPVLLWETERFAALRLAYRSQVRQHHGLVGQLDDAVRQRRVEWQMAA